MTANDKDTIYIDIDDEITTIIDKVRASNEKIVALVLPKRASVLQSIVNMKLLKRTADAEQKRVVLITSEAGLIPLAGAVGLHVAKTLQSRPEIPSALNPAEEDELTEVASLDEATAPEEVTNEKDGARPVGELAGGAAAAVAADDAVETLQLDDEPAAAAGAAPVADKAAKPKKNKKLAVPNFERFRLLLILGALVLILLIVGVILAATVLPKANVIIKTDTSDINSSLTFTASKSANSLDTTPGQLTVPATSKQTQKTQSQQVPTTGKQNNGQKATGTVTMSAGSCSGLVPNGISVGSPLVANGLTYLLNDDVSFVPAVSHGHCTFQGQDSSGDSNIGITAQQGGSNYNTSGNFTVYNRSDVSASGSASGGTDDIIQIVSQSDIDNATQKIAAQDTSAIKQGLQQQLKSAGLFPLTVTFAAAAPNTTTSSNVGDQATTVTVTQTVNYTMLGVRENDLKTLVDNDVKDQIDPSKQSILSEGLDKASFHLNNASNTGDVIAMNTVAVAGPDLKADTIKKAIAGKKAGDVRTMLTADPGVTDVQVNLSPFWVTSVPHKTSRITITFQKAG